MIRSDRIYLAADKERCEPLAKRCVMQSKCARAAAVIAQGSPLMDYTIDPSGAGGTALCAGYINSSQAMAQPAPVRAVRPAAGRL